MGQYRLVVNLDKKQYIHPHRLGDGAKLMELSTTATALCVLLADANGQGGGDCRSNHKVIGSWAGDRVVVTGDYADEGLYGVPEDASLYDHAQEDFEDISAAVKAALDEDEDS